MPRDRTAANRRAYERKMEKLRADPVAYEKYKEKHRVSQRAHFQRTRNGEASNPSADPSIVSAASRTPVGPPALQPEPSVNPQLGPGQAPRGNTGPQSTPPPAPQVTARNTIPIDPALLSEPPLALRTPSTGPRPFRQLDFVTGVRGVQVPESATTIEWPGGLSTVAPTLEVNGENALQYDEAYVRHVASYPQAVPGSAYVDVVDRSAYEDPFDLVVDIRKSISANRPVLVRNFESVGSFKFTVDGLRRSMGISPNMRIDMHDACIRVVDPVHPHVRGTMSELVAGINDPTQCRFTLDIPLSHRSMPPSISMLDDALTVGWSQTQRDFPFEKSKVYADNLAIRAWALAHQAGVFTHSHQDADGDGTYIIGQSGLKIWTFYFVRDATKTRDEVLGLLSTLITTWETKHPELHAESVYLYPGDLLVQPPGQIHSVYTPVASFTIGGHFYSYDSLHLTELARYFDVQRAGTFTNQLHHHAFETLVRMVIGLPRSDPVRKLKHRSLVALCLMVLYPERYKLQGHDVRSTKVVLHGQSIARDLLKSMGYGSISNKHPYFSHPNIRDPGEDFGWFDALLDWKAL